MKATHTNYKHPRHLRVEDGERFLCVSPSASLYAKLNKPGLPCWLEASGGWASICEDPRDAIALEAAMKAFRQS